ncbi:MAG: threonyl-tRNA synthetase, partial [Pseudothermotoga sp.]|nr:threonyl-tRNA synthetase [Pseudothermotoga sp.]
MPIKVKIKNDGEFISEKPVQIREIIRSDEVIAAVFNGKLIDLRSTID